MQHDISQAVAIQRLRSKDRKDPQLIVDIEFNHCPVKLRKSAAYRLLLALKCW